MKKERIEKKILAFVLIIAGMVFLYMGYSEWQLAGEYTVLANKFVERGIHPELVQFDLGMAQTDYMKAYIFYIISVILTVIGIMELYKWKRK